MRIDSKGTPSSSAAICSIATVWPDPMSIVADDRCAVPSLVNLTIAPECS